MALPTVTDIKAVLKIQTTAEDTLLQGMHNRACALMVAVLGRPYEAVERTWIDEGGRVRAYGSLTTLNIPVGPIDPETLVIEDTDAVELVVTDEYRAPEPADALVRAATGLTFSNPPYRLTADVGLSADPEYTTLIEPVLAQALIDTVSDWWSRRSPAATNESTGGGVSTTWETLGLPRRVREALALFSMPRVP